MDMIKSFYRNSITVIFVLISMLSFSQKQDRIWLFADSAGIDFNDLSSPIAINCNLASPCLTSFASIANNQGQLLFYTGGVDLSIRPMRIFDRYGNIMQNGDQLKGYPWVGQGNMIIPIPGDSNKYYVFIIDIDGAMGDLIYYSIVDMSLNGGLGSVISRESLLLTEYPSDQQHIAS